MFSLPTAPAAASSAVRRASWSGVRGTSGATPSVRNAPSVMREKSLGTGHGRSESSHARQVEFERASRFPAERIEIYYDSHANLVARGVIPARPPREPQAFPGPFVPDPWR